MRIVYNNIIPFPGFSAMAFFGYIFARKETKPIGEYTINHECIHEAQAMECKGWILFYLRYLWLWLRYGYNKHPMEKEAYLFDNDLEYLDKRTPFKWKDYL